MKRRIIFFAAFATIFLAGCGNSERTPGEEYYDPEYRARRTAELAEERGTRGNDPTERTDFGAAAPPLDASAAQAPAQPAPGAATGTAATPGTAAGATTTAAPAAQQQPAAQPQPAATAQQQPAAQTAALNPADVEKGKALIGQSDCMACHQIEQRVVGPSYVEVAAKYPPTQANIAFLGTKIIQGGAGNWGQVPMSPHPNIPEADAQNMAKYILSLKK
jgi:cytochrome c